MLEGEGHAEFIMENQGLSVTLIELSTDEYFYPRMTDEEIEI